MFTGYRDIGSLFENYIYNLIKQEKPTYLLEDGIEIDFLTENNVLIEAKYNDSLRVKQQKLFDSFKASKKLTIKNVYDLDKLNDICNIDTYYQSSTDLSSVQEIREPSQEYVANDKCVYLGRRRSYMSVNDK